MYFDIRSRNFYVEGIISYAIIHGLCFYLLFCFNFYFYNNIFLSHIIWINKSVLSLFPIYPTTHIHVGIHICSFNN